MSTTLPTETRSPGPAAKGPGRPRSERAHQAILQAALDLLLEEGFARMSVEAVAARAGVGKATIYRRWPSKAELVVEAACSLPSEVRPVDTGDLRSDLVEFGRRAFVAKRSNDVIEVMSKLAGERARNPELQEAFLRRVVRPRRQLVANLIEHGKARGEIRQDADTELILDLLAGVMHYRAMLAGTTPQAVDPEFLGRVFDLVFEGIAARPAENPPAQPPATSSR